jgi:hypothetical protein
MCDAGSLNFTFAFFAFLGVSLRPWRSKALTAKGAKKAAKSAKKFEVEITALFEARLGRKVSGLGSGAKSENAEAAEHRERFYAYPPDKMKLTVTSVSTSTG